MTDWVARHRESISFVVVTAIGVVLIILGSTLVGDGEPGLVALGAGALGLGGYNSATKS